MANLAIGCGGLDCGRGTAEVEGECVPIGSGICGPDTVLTPSGCTPTARPSERRACQNEYGPVEDDAAGVVFVNAAFGGVADGTMARPYPTLAEAVEAVPSGGVVTIAGGTYVGDVRIQKAMTIEGKCAAEVTVVGAVSIKNTGGVAIRGLTVSDGSPGISAEHVQSKAGKSGLELRYVVVKHSRGAGVYARSADIAVLDSEIQSTERVGENERTSGAGVVLLDSTVATVRGSVVEKNEFVGIDVPDALGRVASLLEEAVPEGSTPVKIPPSSVSIDDTHVLGNRYAGVRIGFASREVPAATDPLVSVTGSNISQNDGYAIRATGRRAQVLGSTLIGNEDGGILADACRLTAAANELTGLVGSGAGFFFTDTVSALSGNQISEFEEGGIRIADALTTSVVGNVLLHNGVVGISVNDVADVTLHENQVTETQAAQFAASGHGIEVRFQALSPVIDFVSIRGNLVSQNEGAGIHLSGATLGAIDDPLYVVATNGVFDNRFIGINIEDAGAGRVEENRIEGNRGVGLRILGVGLDQVLPAITLEENQIGMTSSAINADGDQGDCVLLVDSNVAVLQNRISGCERAGILVSGGKGSVVGNLVQSAAILLGSQDGTSVQFDSLPQAVDKSILRAPL